ncbi:hypothetical protein F9288_09085 [Sphingomonas sp. CL5.1]|uniref:TcfC E-set like domain-containing protein n=1 Tax=Sphingomonas sp. CL5.1 TaxID=2653203 RepID=UPI001584432E|nr:TcfC E-set like domain-containing protein [Sphingomonas sp. CL5.1]QKR99773.1 hypothetical protein F9288_09085 [Sphingomonas sp. CL5.1]
MQRFPSRGSTRRRFGAAALLASAAALPAGSAAAGPVGGAPLAVITVGEPAGFSILTQRQQAVVDIYFGGRRVGDALVTYRAGTLSFADPVRVAGLIPNLADAEGIAARLAAGGLATNAALACAPGSDSAACGRLTPDDIGIIFDQNRFRVDVFVNPRFLAVTRPDAPRYLPAPPAGLSLIDSFGAALSGDSGGPQYYNLRNRLVAGDADGRVRAELYYASGFGVQADRLDMELDRPGWRYLAGAFWAPGSELLGRRKMIGFGAETQTDTRMDKDILRGDPLVVFLARRSRVDIMREGRLVSSGIYEAGNQTLDTSTLPDGSYEVTLRISEAGGAQREERRAFTKNAAVPAFGQRFLFAYAGVVSDDSRAGFLNPTGEPFAQVGAAFRPDRHLALNGSVILADRTLIGELGASLIGTLGQLRLAVIGLSDGTAGGLIRLSSAGNGRLNFNVDARRLTVGKSTGFAAATQPLASGYAAALGSNIIAPSYLGGGDFTAVSGNLSYDIARAQFRLTGTYSHAQGQQAAYSVGPSVRWEIVREGQAHLFANGDFVVTDRGRSGFLGLTLQVFGRSSSLSATAGGQSTDFAGEGRRTSAVGSLYGAWQAGNVAGGELNAGGGYEHGVDRDLLSASGDYRSQFAAVRADLLQNLRPGEGRTQYSLAFDTAIAARGDGIAVDGRQQLDSMVIVSVDAPGPQSRFEVLVNDAPVAEVMTHDRVPLTLIPYRQYAVRIRPLGDALLRYDSAPRTVSLYPGSVASLSWRAQRVAAVFGRIVDRDGRPLGNVAVAAPGETSQTDDNGYFQIEASPDASLAISSAGRALCRLGLPVVAQREGYLRVGTLTCGDRQVAER